jgi:hypothetical protein
VTGRRVLMVVLVAAIAVLATTVDLTGWFGGSTKANKQAVEPPRAVVNLHNPVSRGCSYLFHDLLRYQVISGTWKGKTIRWDKRPQQQGRWEDARQKRTVLTRDNATVAGHGELAPTKAPRSLSPCIKVWNLLPNQAWQRTVARNFRVAWVSGWEAIS